MNRQRIAQAEQIAKRYQEDIQLVAGKLSTAIVAVESAETGDELHDAAIVLGNVAEEVGRKYCLWLGHPKRRQHLDTERIIGDLLEAEESLLTGLDQFERQMLAEKASNVRAVAGKVRTQIMNFCQRLTPVARIA